MRVMVVVTLLVARCLGQACDGGEGSNVGMAIVHKGAVMSGRHTTQQLRSVMFPDTSCTNEARCQKVCFKDKCKATKTSPVMSVIMGMKGPAPWVSKGIVSKRGCCSFWMGACEKCCPPVDDVIKGVNKLDQPMCNANAGKCTAITECKDTPTTLALGAEGCESAGGKVCCHKHPCKDNMDAIREDNPYQLPPGGQRGICRTVENCKKLNMCSTPDEGVNSKVIDKDFGGGVTAAGHVGAYMKYLPIEPKFAEGCRHLAFFDKRQGSDSDIQCCVPTLAGGHCDDGKHGKIPDPADGTELDGDKPKEPVLPPVMEEPAELDDAAPPPVAAPKPVPAAKAPDVPSPGALKAPPASTECALMVQNFAKECGRVSIGSAFGPGADLDFDASSGSMEPSFMCRRLASEYSTKCIGKIEPVVHSPEKEIFAMDQDADANPYRPKK